MPNCRKPLPGKAKTILSALFVMLLWGSLFPLVKLSYGCFGIGAGQNADLLVYAGVRFLVCGIVISAYSVLKKPRALTALKPMAGSVILSGVIAVTLHYGFLYTALGKTASGETAILKQAGSLLYICFSFLFFPADKPNVRKFCGMLLGVLGVLIINTEPGKTIVFGPGDLLILAASFCTVASNIISKKLLSHADPAAFTGISQFFGGLLLLTAGTLLGGSVQFRPDRRLGLFALICAVSVVSYCLWFAAVKNANLSGLFIIKFSEPVFSCIFGFFLLNEDVFTLRYLLSFAAVSVGITVSVCEDLTFSKVKRFLHR